MKVNTTLLGMNSAVHKIPKIGARDENGNL